MFKSILIAGAGGFIGTSLRFIINKIFPLTISPFPIATLIVNLLGCFLFGLFIGWLQKFNLLSSNLYAFLVTGFCGGLTTFSTFSNELVSLSDYGQTLIFILYLSLSIIFGILCVWLGKSIFS